MTSKTKQDAFLKLLEKHRKILYKVANGYCRDRANREDLVQEIVAQLWRSFDTFDGRCRFSTWMYRIALNVAISFYRRERTHTRGVLSDSEHVLNVIDESHEGALDNLQLLNEFIGQLNELDKALTLLFLDGHSYAEIADILGLSETNVATKINRLKKRTQEESDYSTQG